VTIAEDPFRSMAVSIVNYVCHARLGSANGSGEVSMEGFEPVLRDGSSPGRRAGRPAG